MIDRGRSLAGAWIPVAAWCLLIFALSAFPLRVDGGTVPGGDKAAHLLEYAVLGFLLARALRRTRPALGAGGLVAAAGFLGALYGASDEFHQAFVPERTASLGDVVADAAGALLGAAVLAVLSRGRKPVTSPGPSSRT